MAATEDITIDQGATYRRRFEIKGEGNAPIDLTGWQVRSDIKQDPGASAPLASFSVSMPDPTTGVFYLSLSADDTTAMNQPRAYYDVKLVNPSGEVTRLVQGLVTLSPQVTV